MTTTSLTIDEARAFARNLLERHSYLERSAEIIADHLVTAELRGYPGHGFWRALELVKLAKTANQNVLTTVASSKPGFTLFDGGGQIGIVAVHEALELAADKLQTEAATVFGLTDFVGTTGSLGVYAPALRSAALFQS